MRRKNIRISNYDYSKTGYYFVTICIKDRKCLLGKIVANTKNELTCRGDYQSPVELSSIGKITKEYLNKISKVYKDVFVDEYIIMPNHIHMILNLGINNKQTISNIIKEFKRQITVKAKISIWQKSFYEHIVRNEKEYLKIKEYIRDNPINWEKDKYF